MKAFAVYTAGRLLVFVGMAAVLYLVGLRGFLLVAAALLLSLPASYVLLARRVDLRARLRGDDDPAT